jgi:hypothetical protein
MGDGCDAAEGAALCLRGQPRMAANMFIECILGLERPAGKAGSPWKGRGPYAFSRFLIWSIKKMYGVCMIEPG